MRNVSTTNELILLAYNEQNKPDQKRLVEAMQNDKSLRKEFESILKIRLNIDSEVQSPDGNVLKNIISYSKALDVIKTKYVGDVNILMN